jgi:tetratricopeptide (TPR) repeat protein
VTTELDAELDRIFAARNRDDMGPTIAALLPILEQHPDDARVLYEVGGAYDTAGEESTALGFYERAMANGLSGDALRRCYLQYGSTLRNEGRIAESLAVFERARREFPDSVSLAIWVAFSLEAAGRPRAAMAALLDVIADHVDAEELERYRPALRGNAEYLAGLDA